MKCLFLIPAYNEEFSISRVIEELLEKNYPVLVVNDGSKDNTLNTLKKYKGPNLYICSHPVNLGQGAALQTGLECAKRLKPEYLVTYDADGQHRLVDAIEMMNHLDKNPELEILLGSRFLGSVENIPFIKLVVLKFAILFTTIFSGIKLTDTHNGLRVMRRSFYERFKFKQSGMEHASEILDFIALQKIRYEEFPVQIRYTEYSIQKGQSWKNSVKLAAKLLGEKFL